MPRPAVPALLAIALLIPGIAATGEEPSDRLTNEEIVRMVMAGASAREILRRIEQSRAAFDLDPEVVIELRKAGVSEMILRAMRERQAASDEAPPPTAPSAAPEGRIEVTFSAPEDSRKKPPEFAVPRNAPDWAVRAGVSRRIDLEDLALFALCATPAHVPDHWSDRTPLKGFLRHELLAFHPGSRPETRRGRELLVLTIPPMLGASTAVGRHQLVLGVAAKFGPDWHVLASDRRPEVEVEQGGVTRVELVLAGRLAGSTMRGFREEQSVRIGTVEVPEDSP